MIECICGRWIPEEEATQYAKQGICVYVCDTCRDALRAWDHAHRSITTKQGMQDALMQGKVGRPSCLTQKK